MTAGEFIARLAPVDLDRLARIFDCLADHGHELHLESGQALRDGIDFIAFHREVAVAARLRGSAGRTVTFGPVRACSECGHEHEGKNECSKYLGEGKFCHCESRVTA